MANNDGLRIRMEIPDPFKPLLDLLKHTTQKSLVRQSMKAAARPALKHLKREVQILRSVSDQSTGATHRSLVSKVTFPAQNRPGYGYAYIGVDYHHTEQHRVNPNAKLSAKQLDNKRIKGGLRRSIYVGYQNAHRKPIGKNGKQKKLKKGIVKSYQKSPLRKKKGASYQRNTPRYYWHLINDGFTHRSGTVFTGYNFVATTHRHQEQKMVQAFRQTLDRGIQREMEKQKTFKMSPIITD